LPSIVPQPLKILIVGTAPPIFRSKLEGHKHRIGKIKRFINNQILQQIKIVIMPHQEKKPGAKSNHGILIADM
jgi:hypothetical protein